MRLAIFAAVALLSVSARAHAVEIIYQWPSDQVLRYELKTDWSITYKSSIGKVTACKVVDDVLEFREGGPETDFDGVTRVYFREIKRRIVDPDQLLDWSFDTRKSLSESAMDKNPLLRVFPAMIGDFYEIETFANGDVTRISGFVSLVARGVSRGLIGNRMLEKTLTESLSKVFSDSAMKSVYDMAFVSFPDSVSKGSSWKKKFETRGDIGEVWNVEYKVTAASASKVSVAVSGQFVLTVGGQPIEKDSQISGAVMFDPSTGRLLYSSMKASLKLPNVTYANSVEFKFAKSLKPSEAGPESFEKPLRAMQELIERRAVVCPNEIGAPVFSDDRCESVAFFVCHNDIVRVVEKREGADGGTCRIVTALGREGWIRTANTTEFRKID